MEDNNFNVLVDAKTEYTKQLVNMLKSNIYNGIKSIFDDSKNYCNEKSEPQNILKHFQVLLSYIPKWNQEIIEEETNRIIQNTNCDWLEDLITAVFVSHTRILTSINTGKHKKKIDLKIPKVSNFIHKVYIDIARHFWKNAYLFNDSVNKCEYQRNRREAELIIETSINETIRKQLPVKHILKEYLGTDYEEEDDTELIDDKVNTSNNLRKMVKLEIDNCSNEKLKKIKQELNLNNVIDDDKNSLDDSSDSKLKKLFSENSDDNVLEENKPKENKLEEDKLKDNILDGIKLEDAKPEENKSEDNILDEIKVADTKPEENKLDDILDEIKLEDAKPEENKLDNILDEITLEENKPKENKLDDILDEIKLEDNKPKEITLEETKPKEITLEENKPKEIILENSTQNISLNTNDLNFNDSSPGLKLEIEKQKNTPNEISDDELDNILDTEINNLNNSKNDLQIESLDLDDIDDLSTLKEIYVDDITDNKPVVATKENLGTNNEPEKEPQELSNIKKIVIDNNSTSKKKVYKSDEITLDTDDNFTKKIDSRKNIKFFDN